MQAVLPLGPYDPAHPMRLKVSVAERDIFWSDNMNHVLGFWSKALPSLQITTLF